MRLDETLTTPQLQLQTLFVLDGQGRVLRTREPNGTPGPWFALIRGASDHACASHADLHPALATQLSLLAAREPPITDFRQPPRYEQQYLDLVRQHLVLTDCDTNTQLDTYHGAAFSFPASTFSSPAADISLIHDESSLGVHFTGWLSGEIAQGRAPVVAAFSNDEPVSIAFCARRSDLAAEAGVETAPRFRGSGLATRVVEEWARLVRASGLEPLYSASWQNAASMAVARKLRLVTYANNWNVSSFRP